jgi:EmrB/QacA subfamily drug resistance transporter
VRAGRGSGGTRPRTVRPTLVLAICCCSLFVVGVDNTILNVALPALARDLDAPISGLQWTVDAYTLVLACLLLLGGSVADRFGRRRVFQIGLVVFSLASLLCSLAPDLGTLVAFRALQGVGGAMLNPVAISIITTTFPDGRDRARAFGVWGAVAGLSLAVGPVLGGLLVDTVGWRAIFWVNVPVGVAAILLTALFVPESRSPRPRRVDPVGQVLVIVVLGALTTAIIEGPHRGWGSPLILGLFAASALALAAFLRYEPRRRDPLIDPRFFRSVPFAGTTVIAVAGFGALAGALFLNTLYLQEVRGLSPLAAGLWTLPMPATAALVAPLSGRLTGTRGTRVPLLVAGLGMLAGAAWLSTADAGTPMSTLVGAYVLFGLGFGMLNPPITTTAVAGMPRAQAGVAAAVASTSRQVGQSLGVAVVGSAVATAVAGDVAAGFVDASHAAWWIVAGCAATVLVAGLVASGRWARDTADRAAARLGTGDVVPGDRAGART